MNSENKTSVAGRRVHSKEEMKQPGDFFFWHLDEGEESGFCMIWLPGEIGPSSLPFKKGDNPPDRLTWGWDGNFDKPTFTPSIHHPGVWHGYMKAGFLESCS